jgi:hypothetical protein
MSSSEVDIDALIKEEVWRTIAEFPKYEISSFGNIRHLINKDILSTHIQHEYAMVGLNNDKTSTSPSRIHRLLALTFLPNPENYPCVDHIDGDKLNNSLSNLRWCSYSTNIQNWHSKRTNYKKVIQCNNKGEEIKIWNSAAEAANSKPEFNEGCISKCCNPNCGEKSHKGYIWIYADPAHRIPKEDIDYKEYTPIGVINNNKYSNFWIKNDGSIIVNMATNNKLKCETTGGGYKRCAIVSDDGKKKNVALHKVIN